MSVQNKGGMVMGGNVHGGECTGYLETYTLISFYGLYTVISISLYCVISLQFLLCNAIHMYLDWITRTTRSKMNNLPEETNDGQQDIAWMEADTTIRREVWTQKAHLHIYLFEVNGTLYQPQSFPLIFFYAVDPTPSTVTPMCLIWNRS